MTVAELERKCVGMMDDGYADSEIILCIGEDNFHLLERGFSSVVYNRDSIHETIRDLELDEDNCVVLN